MVVVLEDMLGHGDNVSLGSDSMKTKWKPEKCQSILNKRRKVFLMF